MDHLKFKAGLLKLSFKSRLLILCLCSLIASCVLGGLLALLGGVLANSLPAVGPFLVATNSPPVPQDVIFPFHSKIQAIAVTPDGSKLYVADKHNNAVLVIDPEANEITATVPIVRGMPVNDIGDINPETNVGGTRPVNIAIAPDGSRAYVANRTSEGETIERPDLKRETVSVIDTSTDEIIKTFAVGVGPTGIAVISDSSKVYVANSGRENENDPDCSTPGSAGCSTTVSVINVATDTVEEVTVGLRPTFIAITPNDSRAYVANSGTNSAAGNTVSVIDTSNNQVIAVEVEIRPVYIAITLDPNRPDSSKAYVANFGTDLNPGNTVSVIKENVNENRELTFDVSKVDLECRNTEMEEVPCRPSVIVISPDDSKAFVANSGGNSISVIDTTIDKIIDTVSVGPNPNAIAITEDGSKIYVANSGTDLNPGNTVSAVEVETNEDGNTSFNVVTIPVTKTVEASPTALGIARSNVYVASVYRIDVIDIETDTLIDIDPTDPDIDPIHTGKPGPTKIVISHDGSKAYVASPGMDTVSVIDTLTNELTDTVAVGSTPVDIAITPDDSKAYVVNSGLQRLQPGDNNTDTVSVIDTSNNEVIGDPIPVGLRPVDIEITLDDPASIEVVPKAYVANAGTDDQPSNTVSVIDTSNDEVIDTLNLRLSGTIVGPIDILIIPDGSIVYVAIDNNDGAISVIDILQGDNIGTLVKDLEGGPIDMAIAKTSNALKVYVVDFFGSGGFEEGGTVSVIDVQGDPFTVGPEPTLGSAEFRPADIAATPDGSKVYVANSGTFSDPGNTVSVIDTSDDQVVGDPIEVGSRPIDIAITPDSSKVFVTNFLSNTVSVINVETNEVIDVDPTTPNIDSIPVGNAPIGIAITPDGTKAYVANSGSNTVSVIDTSTNKVIQTIDLSPEPVS